MKTLDFVKKHHGIMLVAAVVAAGGAAVWARFSPKEEPEKVAPSVSGSHEVSTRINDFDEPVVDEPVFDPEITFNDPRQAIDALRSCVAFYAGALCLYEGNNRRCLPTSEWGGVPIYLKPSPGVFTTQSVDVHVGRSVFSYAVDPEAISAACGDIANWYGPAGVDNDVLCEGLTSRDCMTYLRDLYEQGEDGRRLNEKINDMTEAIWATGLPCKQGKNGSFRGDFASDSSMWTPSYWTIQVVKKDSSFGYNVSGLNHSYSTQHFTNPYKVVMAIQEELKKVEESLKEEPDNFIFIP